MTKQIKTVLTIAAMLFVSKFSFAGATEDLWTALKTANYPNALTAINAGADLKSLDPAFGSPLNFASCWADIEVVKALIDAKAEVNFIASSNGQSPLMNAASWGNIDAVKLLLASGADIKIRNKPGQTLLSVGIGSAKLDIVKLLVEAGADPNEKFTVAASKDLTLLNSLIGGYAPKEKVENIKSIGTNLSKIGVTFSPRLLNAKEGDFSPVEDLAKYLLEKGADPNQKLDGWGCILSQACELGKTGVVKALIDAKADLNFTGDKLAKTPLFYACSKGNADIVQLLTDAKADLNGLSLVKFMDGKSGVWFKVTPLMIAASLGANNCAEILCKAGADINYVCVKVEHTSESEAGVSYNVKITYKNTALSLAKDNNHPETVTLLKKYGALLPEEIKK